jgi:CO/xanthine dehydrogenase Mo-binding subunit
MDMVARHLGMDPMELRLLNAYRDGDTKAHRKTVDGAALVEVIQAAAREIGQDLPDRFARMSSMNREA